MKRQATDAEKKIIIENYRQRDGFVHCFINNHINKTKKIFNLIIMSRMLRHPSLILIISYQFAAIIIEQKEI